MKKHLLAISLFFITIPQSNCMYMHHQHYKINPAAKAELKLVTQAIAELIASELNHALPMSTRTTIATYIFRAIQQVTNSRFKAIKTSLDEEVFQYNLLDSTHVCKKLILRNARAISWLRTTHQTTPELESALTTASEILKIDDYTTDPPSPKKLQQALLSGICPLGRRPRSNAITSLEEFLNAKK